MPTIDDLPKAVSVSDGDELVLSQSDVARKATRAQLLAGVQPQLALNTGTLLGRMSAGVGYPSAEGRLVER
jgi:type IV secretory pathway TrbD component